MTFKEARNFPSPSTQGAIMTDDPYIIRINIAHYRALLKLDMNDGKRSIVERLLAESRADLARAIESSKDQKRFG
jgi:hypothetical protein